MVYPCGWDVQTVFHCCVVATTVVDRAETHCHVESTQFLKRYPWEGQLQHPPRERKICHNNAISWHSVFRHCNKTTDWPISQWNPLYCPVQWHTLSRHVPPLSQSLDVEQTLASLTHLSVTATNGDNSCILQTSNYLQRLMTDGLHVHFAIQLLLGDYCNYHNNIIYHNGCTNAHIE